MLLFLPILFSIPVISFESYAIDAPYKHSLIQLNGHSYKNSVTVYTIKDELTGMVKVDSQFCKLSLPDDHPLGTDMLIFYPEQNTTLDYFIWRCVTTRENGKLSAEPFRCVYRTENGTNVEMMAGESSQTNNGSIKHHFPGCYHNGTVYTVGQEWIEENPGDKKISVMMGCQRGESGYFEKKVLGCLVTVETYSIVGTYLGNDSYHVTNETYTYIKYMQLNEVEFLSPSNMEGREMIRCAETEPGHVAVGKATEEDVGCTYKNQFHCYQSYWEDLEMGADLYCAKHNEIEKIKNISACVCNGTYYPINPQLEYKLSNGCTFICHHQKNIYKCPDQLSFMEVMKTATTRITTSLRAEFGF